MYNILFYFMNNSQIKFFIFKFVIQIKQIQLQPNKQVTNLSIEWVSKNQNQAQKKIYHIYNGFANVSDQFEISEILSKYEDSENFISNLSSLDIYIYNNNNKIKFASIQIDLSLFAEAKILNQFQRYDLQDCQDPNAKITFALVHVSSFQIDEQQKLNIQKIQKTLDNDQKKRAIKRENNVKRDKSIKSQIIKIDDNKKSKSKNKRSKTKQKLKSTQVQKFIKIIQAKDQIIAELEQKIEKLMNEKQDLFAQIQQFKNKLDNMTYESEIKTKKIQTLQKETKFRNKSSDVRQKRSKTQKIQQVQIEKQYLNQQNKFLKQQIDKYQKNKYDLETKLKNYQDQLNLKLKEIINIQKVKKQKIQSQYKINQPREFQNQSKEYRNQSKEYRNQSKQYRNQSKEYRNQSKQYRNQSKEYRINTIGENITKQTDFTRDIGQIMELQNNLFEQKKKNILTQEENRQLKQKNLILAQQIQQLKKYRSYMDVPSQNQILIEQKIKLREKIYTQQIEKLQVKNKDLMLQITELKNQKKSYNIGMYDLKQQKFKVVQQELRVKILQLTDQLNKKNIQLREANHVKQLQKSQLQQKIIILRHQNQNYEKKQKVLRQNKIKLQNKITQDKTKIQKYQILKKKCDELQLNIKQLEEQAEKQQKQKKQKLSENREMRRQLQEREIEWDKLKRMESDYKYMQDANLKLNIENQKLEKKIAIAQKKTRVLKNSLINVQKGKQKSVREIDLEFQTIEKKNLLASAQNQKRYLIQQDDKLRRVILQLQTRIKQEQNKQILQIQKKKLEQKLQNEIKTKLRQLQKMIDQNRQVKISVQMNDDKYLNLSKKNKILQQQVKQLKQINRQMMKKIVKIEDLKKNYNEIAISEKFIEIKKKQKEKLEEQQKFNKEIQNSNLESLREITENSENIEKINYTKLKNLYEKRIQSLNLQINQYRKKQIDLMERQKQISIKQLKNQTVVDLKKLLQYYEDCNENQVAKMKQKIKSYQQNSVVVQQPQNMSNLKISNIYTRRSEYDENLIAEYKKREKEYKIKIHELEIQKQNLINQKQLQHNSNLQKAEAKKALNQYKKSLEDMKKEFKAEKTQLRQAIIKKQTQNNQLLTKMKMNQSIVLQQIQVREKQIQQQQTKIEQLKSQNKKLKQNISQLNELYNSIKSQQQILINKLTTVNNDNMQLEKALESKLYQIDQLKDSFQSFQKETLELFTQQKIKYELLYENYKSELQNSKLQNQKYKQHLEQEILKCIKLEQEIEKHLKVIQDDKNQVEVLQNEKLQSQNLILQYLEKIKSFQEDQLIFERQYEKLQTIIQGKQNEINQFKAKNQTLQQNLSLTQEFIHKLQQRIADQTNKLVEIITEISKQKEELILKINQSKLYIEQQQQAFEKNRENYIHNENEYKKYIEQLEQKNQELNREIQSVQNSKNEIQTNYEKVVEQLETYKKKKSKKYLEIQSANVKEDKIKNSKTNSYIQENLQISINTQVDFKNKQVNNPPRSQSFQKNHKISKTNKNLETTSIHGDPNKKVSFQMFEQNTNKLDTKENTKVQQHIQPPNFGQLLFNKKVSIQVPQQTTPRNTNINQFLQLKKNDKKQNMQISIPLLNIISPQNEIRQQIINPKTIINFEQNLIHKNEQKVTNVIIPRQYPIQSRQRQYSQKNLQRNNHIYQRQQYNIEKSEANYSEKSQLENESNASQKLQYQKLIQQLQNQINQLKIQLQNQQTIRNQFEIQLNQREISQAKQKQHFQENLKASKNEIQKLQKGIEQINLSYEQLESQNQNLKKQIEEFYQELLSKNQTIQKMRENEKNYQQLVNEKLLIIREFQQLTKENNNEKQYYQKIIKDLNLEFISQNQGLKYQESQVHQLTLKIQIIEQKLAQESNQKTNLQQQYNSFKINCQQNLIMIQNQLQAKNNEASNLYKQTQQLSKNLDLISQKYLQMIPECENLNKQIQNLESQITNKNEQIIEITEKQKMSNKLNDELKSQNNKLSEQLKVLVQEINYLEQEKKNLTNQFISELRNIENIKQLNKKELIQKNNQLKHFQLELTILKKDLQSFNLQNRKLKIKQVEYQQEIKQFQQQIKEIVKQNNSQIQIHKNQCQEYTSKIRSLQELLKQHQNEVNELSQITFARQKLIQELELKSRQLIKQYERQKSEIIEECNSKIQQVFRELNNKYTEQLRIKIEENKLLLQLKSKLTKQLQNQRIEIFKKECKFEQEKQKYQSQKQEYKRNLKKYQDEVVSLVQKFNMIEKERPKIELYQELSFQNQIYKNRIVELQFDLRSKIKLDQNQIAQEFQFFKLKKQRQREQFLVQIQNYSAQVNQLEQKNYQLTQEIQKLKELDHTRIQEIEEENIRMEKQIIRLQNSEEQLLREIRILKSKREQEYKKHYNELRTLKAN